MCQFKTLYRITPPLFAPARALNKSGRDSSVLLRRVQLGLCHVTFACTSDETGHRLSARFESSSFELNLSVTIMPIWSTGQSAEKVGFHVPHRSVSDTMILTSFEVHLDFSTPHWWLS